MLHPGDVKWKEVVFCSPLPHLKKKKKLCMDWDWENWLKVSQQCHPVSPQS